MKKKKLKMKKPLRIFIKIVSTILIILLILFIAYTVVLDKFRSIGYSKSSTIMIFKDGQVSYTLDNPKNKTLNAAFSSPYYKRKNLKHYTNIDYHDGKDFISNINNLVSKGYTDREINIIFKHGDNLSVKRFSKKEKIKYLEEFYSFPYAKLDLYDRYLSYMDKEGDDEETTVLKVNLDLDKDDYKDAVKVKDYSSLVLANKHHYLGEDYIPKLKNVDSKYLKDSSDTVKGTPLAVSAAVKMINAASQDGLNLLINSGYRSYSDQEKTYEYYKNLYGEDYCIKYVMMPGYSEHQTGLSFDFASGSSNLFANSKEYEWMVQNAYKYGFIYRYQKSFEDITGVKHEAWHFRYVGEKAAEIIHKNNMSFEEYYVKYLDKN